MSNSWFHFKQFTVQQEHAAMKVGTDGVLLGAWVSVPGPGSRVLDVGTGTGLIALMISQRTSSVAVDAVEIDPLSARQAEENFQHSPWKEKIRCFQSSFQEFSIQSENQYDLIVCNPPFFSKSSLAPSVEKNLARHDDSLSLEDIFRCAVPLMKKTTIISLILPAQRENKAMDLMRKYHLNCKRLTWVKPLPGKPAKRILLECSPSETSPIEDELTIETELRHRYTEDFNKLIEAFYL